MGKNEEHTSKQSRRKWPWIVLLCLVGIVGLVRLALMTAPVHHWVKNIIVDTANKQLKPQLSIGQVSGDLWNSATLTGIKLTDGRTVASVDTLHIEYSLLSYFSDAFEIHQVQVVDPFIRLTQQQDSTWNVQHWLTSTDTTSSNFTFRLDDLSIKQGRVDVSSIQIPQDSSFVVDELNVAAGLAYLGDSYHAKVDNLSFSLKQTQLDHPLSVKSAAAVDQQSLNLQKLILATGHSMIKASGQANFVDSTMDFGATAKPLGWKDLAAYVDSMPVKKDLTVSLNVNGNANQFATDLQARAEGIEGLDLHLNFRHDSTLALTSFKASANRLDLQAFMSDTTMPRLQQLLIKAEGRVPLADYQKGRIKGKLSAANIRQGDYRLHRLKGTFSLQKNEATVQLNPENGSGRLMAKAHILGLWDDQPAIKLWVDGANINPENWLPEKEYAGSLSFHGEVAGEGWVPAEKPWSYHLSVNNSRLMNQSLEQATFRGQFNRHQFTNTSVISLGQGQLSLKAKVQKLQTTPAFSYNMQARRLDLSTLNGLEKYPSSINAQINGEGAGSSLENLQMQAHAVIDSSVFKGEAIQKFTMDAHFSDSVLTIKNTALKSAMADGTFSGRFNVHDLNNQNNTLNLALTLKDLSSLAPLADVEVLQARGDIKGEIKPVENDTLVFTGTLHLSDINYDNQFLARQIDGDARVGLLQEPTFSVGINIKQPTVAAVDLQTVQLNTKGKLGNSETNGSFELKLAGARKGQIAQSGTYRLKGDSTLVELNSFDLTSSLRTLSLRQPFHAAFANGALQTDTLFISSKENSAFMKLAIPYADSLHQKVYLKAKKLNVAAIQDAILKEPYFQGLLSAALDLDRTDTSMMASGNITMADLEYKDTKLDTLQLQAAVKNERLEGRMQLYQNSKLIAEGDADIPFKAKAPAKLDEDFFNKPVSGHLTLHSLKLERFSNLLQRLGYQNTTGTIQFDGSLDGQAGQPQLNAKLSLKDAQLSGVPIDSLIASAHYKQEESALSLNATLTSLKQKALEVNAQMPLKVDLRTLDVGLPGPQDSVSVDVQTNNFDLKALNDFVNRSTARNISGRIDGQVKIRGPRNNLQTNGQLTLKGGAVRVVPAGIRLDHIRSTMQFDPDKIVLKNFHTESGKGDLDAQGQVGLKQLVPGDIDISINAKNFKAANTDEYNALVNLNMNVGGSVNQPRVTGKLQMINGFIKLDNFGEKSVEQVTLDTTLSSRPDVSMYDSLGLDMQITFNRRFFVRNQRYLKMEIELDGSIDLKKEAGNDLQMFGTINTSGGYAEPLGKRFELKEGSLAFSGPPDNPQINIRTLYEPPQSDQKIKIYYIIEGTVENPQFKYESEPQMDLAGIISYTLFGQPFYKLNPAEQTVAGSSSNNVVNDLAMEVLMDHIESLATRRLGIDVVRIENTRVGGKSGTSVTTGWYINPKVFFAIQNVITGSTPTTGFYLEYYLKKNLKLILSQGNDNRQGVDVQWEYDY